MNSRTLALWLLLGATLLSGCVPARQPTWRADSKSFLYTHADGSVAEYDLEKEASRTVFEPPPSLARQFQPKQVALVPHSDLLIFAHASMSRDGRNLGYQAAFANLADREVGWTKLIEGGNEARRSVPCATAAYATQERVLLWCQRTYDRLAPDAGPELGRFAVGEKENGALNWKELTTAPPAVMLCQAINVSPLTPDGSGYLAAREKDGGAYLLFVTWDGWEYPLEGSQEILEQFRPEVLKQFLPQEADTSLQGGRQFLPLPQGRWFGRKLRIPTAMGSLTIDCDDHKVVVRELPQQQREELERIKAFDAETENGVTMQTARFSDGPYALHLRIQRGTPKVFVELVHTKTRQRRLLKKGERLKALVAHHLHRSPDGKHILVSLIEPGTEKWQLHVVQSDGNILTSLDLGKGPQ